MDERTPDELVAAWLDESLDAKGKERLFELLRDDPALAEKAARSKSMERLLRMELLAGNSEIFVQELALRCGVVGTGGNLVRNVHWRVRWLRWAALAAAACVVIGGAFTLWRRIEPMAVVVRTESVQWPEGQRALQSGEKLPRGHVALTSGYLALRSQTGAELIVEGPAEFDLVRTGCVRLWSGSVFAHVPERAIGFTVEGPTGRVIDKGTDFGVRVAGKGMEVHVLKGEVEAEAATGMRTLHENEALKISEKAVSPLAADARQFRTDLPPPTSQPIGWVHWGFNENEGNTTETAAGGMSVSAEPARLLSLDSGPEGPQWTTGVFGSALSFDGEDDYVQTDFAGIGGSAARTVAFWVKVPRDFQPRNGYAMVGWGSTQELTEGWQISINPKEDAGPMGRIRVARIGGPIIGTTDLRDDRWHHVAVIYYGGELPQRATQVLIYIDGALEQTERKGFLAVRTDTSSPGARKVAFALNLGPRNPNPARPPRWRVFRGCLDEVFICDAALSQSQIHDLMTRNCTPGFAAGRPQ